MVFYAGHGIEVDQRNFLVPVDARLASDRDVEYEAVPLKLVQRAVERASGLRLVILDACRENPFAAKMQRAGATRSIGRGLARVEPTGETLIAYAAKEGTVALDGTGRNSPYSEALLAHLEKPGLEVMFMLRKVRDAVLAATGGRQEPFWYGSLSSRGVYLAKASAPVAASSVEPAPAIVPDAARVTAEQLAVERVYWESVKDSEDPVDILAYLDQFPGGMFAALARNRLERLEDAVKPSTSPVSKASATAKQKPSSFAHRIPDASTLRIPRNDPGKSFVGSFTGADGSLYRGGHTYGDLYGHGTYVWADGSRYEGNFHNSKMHGRGTYTSPDGRAWTCEWRKNAIISGTCESRLEEVGEPSTPPVSEAPATAKQKPSSFAHRIPDASTLRIPRNDPGKSFVGSFTGADGSLYRGGHTYGDLYGHGTYVWADGSRYEGNFHNSKMHGRGTYTSPDGRAWDLRMA